MQRIHTTGTSDKSCRPGGKTEKTVVYCAYRALGAMRRCIRILWNGHYPVMAAPECITGEDETEMDAEFHIRRAEEKDIDEVISLYGCFYVRDRRRTQLPEDREWLLAE